MNKLYIVAIVAILVALVAIAINGGKEVETVTEETNTWITIWTWTTNTGSIELGTGTLD